MYIIEASVVSPETLLVEIPEEKVKMLVADYNNNFERLVKSVNILNKKLVLMASYDERKVSLVKNR